MKFNFLLCIVFSVFIMTSCSNEDIDDNLFLTAVDLIAQDTELFNLLENVTEEDSEYTCIHFVYSFDIAIYDENNEEIALEQVSSDAEFYFLLDSLEDGHSIGMSFPITSELEDGTTFEVNTLEELQDAIADCREEWQEEVISECNGYVQECVWEVAIPEDLVYSTYIDAVFAAGEDGGIDFFYRGVAYNGTWIVYFIEDELHLNINLDNQDQVGEDWNFDWKIDSYNSILIELSNDNEDRFILNRECEAGNYCTTLTFEECELDDNSAFAEFDLASYADCIIIIAAPQPEIDEVTGVLPPPIDWEVAYYETVTDAQLAVNPIITGTPYLNTTNGQEVYVRIVNPDTQEFLIAVITLEAIFCE